MKVFLYKMSAKSTIKNPFKKIWIMYTNKELFIKSIWDAKSDEEIREAYEDNVEWLKTQSFLKPEGSKVLMKMYEGMRDKFENLIKPQVIERKLGFEVDLKKILK